MRAVIALGLRHLSPLLFAAAFALGCSSSESSAPAGAADAAVDTGPPVVGEVQRFAELEGSSEGIAFATDASTLYVGSSGAIHRVAVDGAVEKVIDVPGVLGIAARPDGKLLACGKGEGAIGTSDMPGVIWLVDPVAKTKSVLIGPSTVASYALTNYVAIARDGSIVWSDSAGNKVWRATKDGGAITLVTDAITYPNGLAFAATGDLYVASWSTKTVFVLRPSAEGYGPPAAMFNEVENVDGIAIDSTGALYLVCSGRGIVKANNEGTSVIAAGSNFKLAANGAFGVGQYGSEWLYVTNLIGSHVSRVWTGVRGAPLPP